MLRPDRLTLPLLLLLTLIAGVLRFTALDRPSLWGDEAMTYGRVCGTYQELLDQLADSAFTPLHYVMEWWIGQGLPYAGTLAPPAAGTVPLGAGASTKPVFTPTRRIVAGGIPLTPFALRFVPALAGTLMVPALFWLARQLFGPRVALTAALLACFSAYGLVYSRDAKMYMHFWLAVTLHVGCTLWWVRTRRPIAWALWVLFGVLMIGLHATGFYVLVIDAVIVFTSPRQHWLRLAGLVAWPFVVLPYYVYERRRRGRLDGLRVLHGRVPEPVSTRWRHFLLFPRLSWRQTRWPVVLGFVLGGVLMAAGPVGYYQNFSRKYQRLADENAPQVDTGELGIDWVDRYNADRGLGGHVLYTTSAFLTGWEWPRNYAELKKDPAAMAQRRYTEIRVPLDDTAAINPRTLVLLQTATVLLLAMLAIGLVPWRRLITLWVGRRIVLVGATHASPGVANPARRARHASPLRRRGVQDVLDRMHRVRQEIRVAPPFRKRRAAWLAVWGLALPWAVYTQSFARPANPLDGAAAVLLRAPPDVAWPRVKSRARPPERVGPAADKITVPPDATPPSAPQGVRLRLAQWRNITRQSWQAVCLGLAQWRDVAWQSWNDVASAWPAAWAKYSAAYRWDNLNPVGVAVVVGLAAACTALVILRPRRLGVGAWRLTQAVVVALVLGMALALAPRFVDADVWMPRYLGAALPALAVMAAVRIDRQPRGLRWATLLLFVVVNSSQYSARVWGGSEPPVGLMAADVVASQPKSKSLPLRPERPSFRVYLATPMWSTGEPGGGTLFTPAGRTYLRVLSGVPSPASSIRFGGYESVLTLRRAGKAEQISGEIKRSPEVTRFVVWSTPDRDSADQSDAVAEQLKGLFRRVDEETWMARDHWRWVERFKVRRRTYDRVAAGK